MENYRIRYAFEHKLIPHYFYEQAANFIGTLLNDREVLFRIIDDMYEQEGVDNPYTSEQFQMKGVRISDEVMMLKITFPEPDQEPFCYCSYLFFDSTFEKLGYYCIERGTEATSLPYVCSWSADGVHHNYGNCTLDNDEAMLMCADMFMEREFGYVRLEED